VIIPIIIIIIIRLFVDEDNGNMQQISLQSSAAKHTLSSTLLASNGDFNVSVIYRFN